MSAATEEPNVWQAAHQDAVHADTCRAACDLIDRKLIGEHRKEARKWVRRSRYDTQIRALMDRLESLPDLGDAS